MTYEFICDYCRIKKEVFMPISASLGYREICPRCKTNMRRIFTVPAIKFVGPGFHCNDYKNNGAKKRDKKNTRK